MTLYEFEIEYLDGTTEVYQVEARSLCSAWSHMTLDIDGRLDKRLEHISSISQIR